MSKVQNIIHSTRCVGCEVHWNPTKFYSINVYLSSELGQFCTDENSSLLTF